MTYSGDSCGRLPVAASQSIRSGGIGSASTRFSVPQALTAKDSVERAAAIGNGFIDLLPFFSDGGDVIGFAGGCFRVRLLLSLAGFLQELRFGLIPSGFLGRFAFAETTVSVGVEREIERRHEQGY